MQPVDPLATIVHKESAYKVGKALAARLKELIPRQQFKVPIQAAIGARIVASESISGMLICCCLGAPPKPHPEPILHYPQPSLLPPHLLPLPPPPRLNYSPHTPLHLSAAH